MTLDANANTGTCTQSCGVRLVVHGPLLTVSEAIRVLGIRAADARAWLDRHGLISEALGAGERRRVVLADLLQAIRDHHRPEEREKPRPRGRTRLPRVRV